MLICPICQAALTAHNNSLRCSNQHNFDRARQGYINLLPVQHKKSRAPGDNLAMVQARRNFLSAGHYAPLAQRFATLMQERQPQQWLDIGCGEGYYSERIAQALHNSQGYAVDISRDAVKQACQRSGDITWLVASMARLPLASASCQAIASIFSPIDWAEAQRVLAPGGALLRMGPSSEHLLELRQRLYTEVHHYDDRKHLQQVPAGMRHVYSENLYFHLSLDDAQQRSELLAMTPHGWRASATQREAVINQPLTTTIAVRYDWFEKTEN
ncbi:MAG TPA: methyltransferase domain-containing protein [Thiopseudomonas sp.]|nr:methyltransferase domain-containing protein [Thiopseudomonas sp.]